MKHKDRFTNNRGFVDYPVGTGYLCLAPGGVGGWILGGKEFEGCWLDNRQPENYE